MTRYETLQEQYRKMTDMELVYHRHQAKHCYTETPDKMEIEIADSEYDRRRAAKARNVTPKMISDRISVVAENTVSVLDGVVRQEKPKPKFKRRRVGNKREVVS